MDRGARAGLLCCALTASAGVSSVYAAENLGAVCISPLPKDAEQADRLAFAAGPLRRFRYDFAVQIDSRPSVPVGKDESVAVEGLTLTTTHLLRIRDGGRVVTSFRFRLHARGSARLCLAYQPGYQTWHLAPPRAGQRCCQAPTTERSGAACDFSAWKLLAGNRDGRVARQKATPIYPPAAVAARTQGAVFAIE